MVAVYLRAFIEDETGATAIEYGLVAMLTCLGIIGSFTLVGDALVGLFDNGAADIMAEQTAKID
ncbi:MAG: Flp family type IVb pilin [Devosia sp.]|jgi:pilus assembly protein Flp/PilA|nr:Flp family type IVb pilin [Devosia sp.]